MKTLFQLDESDPARVDPPMRRPSGFACRTVVGLARCVLFCVTVAVAIPLVPLLVVMDLTARAYDALDEIE